MLAETKTPENHSAELLGRSFAKQMIEQGASSKDLLQAVNSILAEALLIEEKKDITRVEPQKNINLQVIPKKT